MEREDILRKILTLAESETDHKRILVRLHSEFSLVEQIVDKLAEHWQELPLEFCESMISICVALLCNGRRDRRVREENLRVMERRNSF